MTHEIRRRILRETTPEERERHRAIRREIEQELPELKRWARETAARHREQMARRVRLGIVLIVFGASGWHHARAERPVDFDREVRPILSEHCYACHGPDQKARKAKLRLDRKEDAFRDRGGLCSDRPRQGRGERADRTRHLRRSRRGDAAAEIQEAPERASRSRSCADGSPRGRSGRATGRSRCRRACRRRRWRTDPGRATRSIISCSPGWRPRDCARPPEADRATLIRRVSLDLIGLPPTPAEVDAFERDPSPDAYERLVDRLLASPALRRAPGAAVARPGALRRHQRLREGRRPIDLALSRLGHRGLQPRHAVRPVHDRADRRRPAPGRDARPADRHRLPSQHDGQHGGRDRRRGIPGRGGRRSGQHHDAGLDGDDDRLCPVPRPQVRPLLAEGVFPALRVLQQHRRPRREHRARASPSPRPHRPPSWPRFAPSWRGTRPTSTRRPRSSRPTRPARNRSGTRSPP